MSKEKITSKVRNKPGKPASDNPHLIALGKVLADRRRQLGLRQQDVAESAQVSRSTLHTIERGGTGVRWEKVLAVAHVLGMGLQFIETEG